MGALVATVTSSEFRGRDHTGFARMSDGTELVFHADRGAVSSAAPSACGPIPSAYSGVRMSVSDSRMP